MTKRTMTMMRWSIMALVALIAVAHGAAEANKAVVVPSVIWYAPFLSGGGYCSEAHSYVTALHEVMHEDVAQEPETAQHGDDVISGAGSTTGGSEPQKPAKLFNLYLTQHGDSYNAAFIRNLPEESRDVLEQHWIEERDFHWRLKKQLVAIAVCHSEPGAWHPARYKTSRCPPAQAMIKVGRTMFETDRVPKGWPERMNKMDEIWVPTKFQEKIFADGGVEEEKLVVVPEAVDIHFFDPAKVSAAYDLASQVKFTMTDSTTVFLSIFKWEERKGWKILLKAYFQAFARQDDVVLVLLTNAYHVEEESAKDFMETIEAFTMAELGKKLSELPHLHLLPPHIPQSQMPSLYKAATAFVLPSRGEGWGRPHVEAMSMGLPLISTFWSGMTEYMTEENSYPLRIDGLVEIEDGAFRGHKWANPSVDHLIELMTHVRAHPEEARKKGKQARQDMVTRFSPEVIGKIVLGHFKRLLKSLEDANDDVDSTKHEEL